MSTASASIWPSALARELHEVDRLGAFFDIIRQDPVLSQVKLIAEPWDLGEGGYQVGNFPVGWAEWNDRYRDTVRAYWKGDGGLIGEFAPRLTGSSDLYESSGRKPYASINFVTAHDGFTLHDLVSYNDKHNEANGEDNRDGAQSTTCPGTAASKGRPTIPKVRALRARQKRNLLATLFLSQGVPMLLAGDEMGRTQHGNNNAYCQDNEISWIDWELDAEGRSLLAFTQRVIALRRAHPVFHRRSFYRGRAIRGLGVKDIAWFRPEGDEMSDEEWAQGHARCLGMRLSGDAIEDRDERGNTIRDDTFLVLFNAHHEEIPFKLPVCQSAYSWRAILDTHHESGLAPGGAAQGGEAYALQARSLALMIEERQ